MKTVTGSILRAINDIADAEKWRRVIVAIDGRCASGKTTLASLLQSETDCAVFHMDDYFLRPEQRTEERLSTPGGNVDSERFLEEILLPLKNGAEAVSFRPFCCKTGRLSDIQTAYAKGINVIEGSYSCHPLLYKYYDLRVFLSVSPKEQIRRIEKRNGKQSADVFRNKWIPLEESYFQAFDVEKNCDMRFVTDDL